MIDRGDKRTSNHTDSSSPRPNSILSDVQLPLLWRGFNLDNLREDVPKTQEGSYHWESYLLDGADRDPANLALISLPAGVATNPNLFIGPSGEERRDFSFAVHALAGHGELIILKPGGSIEVHQLYRGAAVHTVRAGDIYAVVSGDRGLVVGDYCDPRFQPEWEIPVEDTKLPVLFRNELNKHGVRGRSETDRQCD